jgi:ankyrin repeat protein
VKKGIAADMLAAIRCGCDPDHVCYGGMTPLHTAVEIGDAALARELVTAGASIDAKVRGAACCPCSAYRIHTACDVSFQGSYCTSSGIASEESVALDSLSLREEGSMDTISSVALASTGPTPILLACLLDKLIMVGITCVLVSLVTWVCALWPHAVAWVSQVQLLVELHADTNVAGRVFEHASAVPLCVAMCRDDVGMACTLLDAGAMKYWMDDRGRAPLSYAARCGSVRDSVALAL